MLHNFGKKLSISNKVPYKIEIFYRGFFCYKNVYRYKIKCITKILRYYNICITSQNAIENDYKLCYILITGCDVCFCKKYERINWYVKQYKGKRNNTNCVSSNYNSFVNFGTV